MYDVAEKLKDVKGATELPESLEDINLEELKTEFAGMKELVGKIRTSDYDKLPAEMQELDLEELETEFDGFKDTVE
jgi:hypothetical protein